MVKMKVLMYVFFLMIVTQKAEKTNRRKRYLIYPKYSSKVQLQVSSVVLIGRCLQLIWQAKRLDSQISSQRVVIAKSLLKFILGTGVPIPLENHAITMGWVVKSMYLLPTNASQYTDSYVTFQKRSIERRASRYDYYRTLENAAASFGGGGKECMLRTICEASRIPLQATGLVGQILRIFLSPSSTDETPITRSDIDYHNAEILGKEKDIDCRSVYPSCSFTLIDLLTVIV